MPMPSQLPSMPGFFRIAFPSSLSNSSLARWIQQLATPRSAAAHSPADQSHSGQAIKLLPLYDELLSAWNTAETIFVKGELRLLSEYWKNHIVNYLKMLCRKTCKAFLGEIIFNAVYSSDCKASYPSSPVRTRTTFSTSCTKIFPSPIWPVWSTLRAVSIT